MDGGNIGDTKICVNICEHGSVLEIGSNESAVEGIEVENLGCDEDGTNCNIMRRSLAFCRASCGEVMMLAVVKME